MNLANRRFKNNLTGDIVRVLDSFENIVILDDKSRMDAKHLTNAILYTDITGINENANIGYNTGIYNPSIVDEVSPDAFFNNQGAYNILADKIKSIPENMIKDDPNAGQVSIKAEDMSGSVDLVREQANKSESAVIMVSEEDERAQLARKYGATNDNALQKQNEAFSRLLNDEPKEEVTQVFVKDRDVVEAPTPQQTLSVEDPILRMFKGVKRNTNFAITLDINNKIPRADFIEMMEDSYETSLIEFLADEFTNNIINNPGFIKDMIIAKIKETVYGSPIDKLEETPKEDKPKVIAKELDKTKEVKSDVKKPRRVARKKEENI
jgi:hypothetical protein